ncbi:hypothetical protein N1F78_03995 [Seonamhaeicola sp. MEBiC1930]|uniref:hypothetical protein n=1 Tax=Seonamhaeicola sp. MEBiC01930 TaxID=2976768 RepID=UPI0032468DB3
MRISRKLPTLILLLCFISFYAQQKAITERGEEVILFEDGTWKYQNEEVIKETEIPTNPEKFEKDTNSTFLLKSNKLNVGFWLDPKVWSFKKATDNPEAEYELQVKDGDLYGMVISEKVEIPLEMLKTIALENGKAAAPDLKIVKEEYRMVNDLKVLLLQMDGTMYGIKFSYYGYYFSHENGTVQFITYTSQNLLEESRDVCEKLLNGIVKLDE